MLALDWHLEFPAPAAGSWDWIGIRAHRFQLAEGPGPYVFPYEVVHRIEDTFSYILQIRRQGDPEAKPLRWEVEKALHLSIPDRGYGPGAAGGSAAAAKLKGFRQALGLPEYFLPFHQKITGPWWQSLQGGSILKYPTTAKRTVH